MSMNKGNKNTESPIEDEKGMEIRELQNKLAEMMSERKETYILARVFNNSQGESMTHLASGGNVVDMSCIMANILNNKNMNLAIKIAMAL